MKDIHETHQHWTTKNKRCRQSKRHKDAVGHSESLTTAQ